MIHHFLLAVAAAVCLGIATLSVVMANEPTDTVPGVIVADPQSVWIDIPADSILTPPEDDPAVTLGSSVELSE